MNKEEQFNEAIAQLVIAMERAGVYDDHLKGCIDTLFTIKDLVLIRDSAGSSPGRCYRCKNYTNGHCSDLKIPVQEYFSCSHYLL